MFCSGGCAFSPGPLLRWLPPIFSDGFARLRALGIPVPDAEDQWVGTESEYYSGADFAPPVSLADRGWLSESNGRFLGPRLRELPVQDEAARELREDLIKRLRDGDETAREEWMKLPESINPTEYAPADLREDVAAIIAYCRESEQLDADDWEWQYYTTPVMGEYFVLAAQIDALGDPDLANELAAALFALVGHPYRIIDAAVSLVADARLARLTNEFHASSDWTSYRDGLTGLVREFPRGWDRRSGVLILGENVRDRLTIPPPRLAREAMEILPQGSEKILEEIMASSDGGKLGYLQGDWLLPPLPREEESGEVGDVGESEASAERSSLEELLGLKADALPFLAAMVESDRLSLTWTGENDTRFNPWAALRDNRADPDDPEETYETLPRPRSARELAQNLILYAIPESAIPESYAMEGWELAEATLEWWRLHRELTPVELARLYFHEGSASQKQTAIAHLHVHGTSQDDTAIRKWILTEEYAGENLDVLGSYCQAKKEAAAKFLGEYLRQFEKRPRRCLRRMCSGNARVWGPSS